MGKMENLIEIKNRIKNVFDAFDMLEVKGKNNIHLTYQMIAVLQQALDMLEEEIKPEENK